MSAYNPRPLWRWWLFCAALEVFDRARIDGRVYRAASGLMAWAVLPGWLGHDGQAWPEESDEVPFSHPTPSVRHRSGGRNDDEA